MKLSNKARVFAAGSIACLSLIAISSPSMAQVSGGTTASTDPDTVLDSFQSGTQKMDDIGGAAAAVGMASCIFGGAALIFKRFIYS